MKKDEVKIKPWILKRKITRWLLLLILFSGVLELCLRSYGFCNAVLVREDSAYEYIAIPQDRQRFGKHIFYNKFSQRNEEINPADSIIICVFGDSFINGGTAIDQDSLATTKLSRYLSKKNDKPVKVLNISAGSWGPDNCYAYLLKQGSFNSHHFILFVSSHDAYDNMDFKTQVGVNPNYPDKQYNSAIVELFGRYLIPGIINWVTNKNEEREINKKTGAAVFNTGFLNFYNYCVKSQVSFTVYLHATEEETERNAFNEQGKMIIEFCKKKNIRLINELDFNFSTAIYRDLIHFNNGGQEKLFEKLKDTILP